VVGSGEENRVRSKTTSYSQPLIELPNESTPASERRFGPRKMSRDTFAFFKRDVDLDLGG
jgi:hypothetical protein